ncbi:MAG: hypothetical protein A2201_12865 [Alicyclobacillus sp. RIFOXYA1_FULL_53_8]|nr:MAG: hypothetical protein A2201_12865 [Alicyclobacillus sp. RIFOXYA1_FULL_53_8]
MSMTKRTIAAWVLSVALAVSLTGCWGQQEVGDISIMLGLGIDKTEDGTISVTVQVVNPGQAGGAPGGGTGGKGREYINHESTGKTVEEALDRLYENSWRPLFVAHNAVVVFGQAYARDGIDEAIDYFDRNKDFRRIQVFAVTSQDAHRIFMSKPGIERINARAIRELIDLQVERGSSVRSIQLEVTNEILSPSHSPLMARVETDERGELKADGSGLFRGGKLVGFLGAEDTRGALWFRSSIGRTQMFIPCSDSANPASTSAADTITIGVLNASASVEPVLVSNEPRFTVHVRGAAEIERLCPSAKPTEENMQKWRGQLNQAIGKEMETTMQKLQAQDVDAINFGTRLFQSNPVAWRKLAERWSDVFPTVQVRYDVNLNILRTGMNSGASTSGYTPESLPPEHGRKGAVK